MTLFCLSGGVDPILRGLVGQRAKLNTQDNMMNTDLRDRLFKFLDDLALDLAALNLQRGRDHGWLCLNGVKPVDQERHEP